MRIAVEGKLYQGVAEALLDVLWMRATREKEGGAGVLEVVPAYVGQSCAL